MTLRIPKFRLLKPQGIETLRRRKWQSHLDIGQACLEHELLLEPLEPLELLERHQLQAVCSPQSTIVLDSFSLEVPVLHDWSDARSKGKS
jgi:hypothetical protein